MRGVTKEESDSLLDHGAQHDLSTYTVESAIEKIGFGRFQVRLILICGALSAADAMEMMLLSVLGPALRCDWLLSSSQVALITTVVFLGMLFGSPFWGQVSDKFGRWPTFLTVLLMISYFGFLTSFSHTYLWLVLIRCLVGFGIGGVPVGFTLLSEYLPSSHRAKCLVIANTFWAVGSTFEIALANVILPRFGWRWLVALSAIPCVIFTVILRFLPESARFLVAAGRRKEAVITLNHMAKVNGKPPLTGVLAAPAAKEKRGAYRDLFHAKYRVTTIILLFLWFGIAFTYYGIVLVTSEIYQYPNGCYTQHENATFHVDTSCCMKLSSNSFTTMLISSLGEFTMVPLNFFLIDRIGRKWTLACNFVGNTVFLLVVCICLPKFMLSVVLMAIRAFSTGVFGTIYIYTSEVYPTTMRSLGLGMCSSFARFGSMTTPFVAQVVMSDVSTTLGFVIYVCVNFVCTIVVLMLPIETKNREMPQTLHSHATGYVDSGGESDDESSFQTASVSVENDLR